MVCDYFPVSKSQINYISEIGLNITELIAYYQNWVDIMGGDGVSEICDHMGCENIVTIFINGWPIWNLSGSEGKQTENNVRDKFMPTLETMQCLETTGCHFSLVNFPNFAKPISVS